jgi:hypothetical protein
VGDRSFLLDRVVELGGKWAPSPTYGVEIENLMQQLSV